MFVSGKFKKEMVVRPVRMQRDQGGEDQERVIIEQRGWHLLHSGK